MVQLKEILENGKVAVLRKFQFLMVQLKVPKPDIKALLQEFQFLMVQLKETGI